VIPLLTGLLLGIVIGLLLGPLVRSWLAWREYTEASREARLHDEVLRAMTEARSEGGDPADDSLGAERR
jgi:hypothetical protein